MNYPKEAIEKTSAWVAGDQRAKQWLMDHNFEELVQLRDAARRYTKSLEFLFVHKHIVLAAFVNAIWEDKKAFKLLMDQRAFQWAAMANYINGDENAALFLKKNNRLILRILKYLNTYKKNYLDLMQMVFLNR